MDTLPRHPNSQDFLLVTLIIGIILGATFAMFGGINWLIDKSIYKSCQQEPAEAKEGSGQTSTMSFAPNDKLPEAVPIQTADGQRVVIPKGTPAMNQGNGTIRVIVTMPDGTVGDHVFDLPKQGAR